MPKLVFGNGKLRRLNLKNTINKNITSKLEQNLKQYISELKYLNFSYIKHIKFDFLGYVYSSENFKMCFLGSVFYYTSHHELSLFWGWSHYTAWSSKTHKDRAGLPTRFPIVTLFDTAIFLQLCSFRHSEKS